MSEEELQAYRTRLLKAGLKLEKVEKEVEAARRWHEIQSRWSFEI